MLDNKLFLIGFGAFYAMIITIIALFFSIKLFNFLNKFNNREYNLKIIALILSIFIWILVIAIFWNISWKFPIDDSLWNFFASSHLLVMWLTLTIYFKKNRKGH